MIDNLLSRLQKVKPNGKHRWMACCPAHADRTPSLSITEQQNGKISVKCFAGCSGEEIMNAIDMSLAMLYPDWNQHTLYVEHPSYETTMKKKQVSQAQKQIDFDLLFIDLYKNQVKNKDPNLTQEDHSKARAAFARLKKAGIEIPKGNLNLGEIIQKHVAKRAA